MKKAILMVAVFVSLILQYGCAATKTIKVTDPRTGKEYTVDPKFNDVPGVEALAKVCAEEGGQEIREVVYAEGYYDEPKDRCNWDCFNDVVLDQFSYIEISVSSRNTNHAFDKPGLWKVFRAKKGHKLCKPYLNQIVKNKGYEEFLSVNCVATQKQSSVQSSYGYKLENNLRSIDPSIGKLLVQREDVIDYPKDKTIAWSVRAILTPKNYLWEGWTLECADLSINNIQGGLPLTAIKPFLEVEYE